MTILGMPGLHVGQSATLSRRISDEDVRSFAALTGDTNPIHLDDEYASATRFGRRIAHGLLGVSLIGTLLGTRLPGPGALYLQQSVKFLAPVYIDDVVTATVEVTSIRQDKPVVSLRTSCHNQRGEMVIDGEAVLIAPA